MAAELVLTPLINKTVEIAANLIVQEASRLYWLKSDIDWLQQQLNLMQSYLQDAQAKEAAGDSRVATLMKHIEELALDVEDLLDTYLPQMQSLKGKRHFRWLKKVARFFGSALNAHKFAMEIEKIKRKVQEIDQARTTYGIAEADDSREENVHEEISRRSILYIDETEIIGRDKNANKLEAKLLDPSVNYGVISIVGMPGLGKTTLAKRIYNRVKDRFDCSAMEYVSQVPKVKELLQSIARQVGVVEKLKKQQKQLEGLKAKKQSLEEMVKEVKELKGKRKVKHLEKQLNTMEEREELETQLDTVEELEELEKQGEEELEELEKQVEELEKQPKVLENLQLKDLQDILRSFLNGRKYVILLDDIWAIAAWDDLKCIFPSNPKIGSRLIITSRNNNIGRYIGGESSLHQLKPLNSKDTMTLFWNSVMAHQGDTNYLSDLEDIGREIAKKCGGVPLAIVLTAGILRARERNERQWGLVLKSMGHNKENKCSRIIALSYTDLPSKLKPCFLYLGIFPEDYAIPAFRLINMWVAEKFIGANGTQEVEEVGEDYLYDLAARNLVQVVKRGFDGRIKSCRVHDLLHSLCINVAQENNFFYTLDTLEKLDRNSGMKVRRLTTHLRSIDDYIALNPQMPKLRALLCFSKSERLEDQHRRIIFGEHRFLRVLRVYFGGSPEYFPKRIRKFRQLGYLEVDGLVADTFHFRKLENLQSIDFGRWLTVGSDHIWKMEQLRHLARVSGDFSPPTEASLPNLQTLDISISIWRPKMLLMFNKLPNLRRLRASGHVRPMIEALSGTTPMMPKIEILKFDSFPSQLRRVNLSRYPNLVCLDLSITLEKMPIPDEFPPNLIKLTLKNSELKEDLMKTLGRLPKLKILKLCEDSYMGKSMYCSGVDSFPHLKVLVLRSLPYLREVMVDDGVLPQLQTLVIKDCPTLKKIPERLQVLTKMADPKGSTSAETEM